MGFIEKLESRIQFNGGTIDTTFGDDGRALVNLSTPLGADWHLEGSASTQDSGGRIYAIGFLGKSNSGTRLVIARLTRDGQLDPNFSEAGFKVLERDPNDYTSVYDLDISVDQNNRVHVVDGHYLWRLTPGGRIDLTFGRRGKIVVPLLTDVTPSALAFDANGQAYVGGSSKGKTGTRMTVIRLSEAGAWDTTWGFGGAYKSPVRATPDTVPTTPRAHASLLKFFPNGQLAVVGQFSFYEDPPDYPGTISFATSGVWSTRLGASGDVDPSYGSSGYAQYTRTNSDVDWGTSSPLALAPDGAVIGVVSGATDYPDGDAASFGWNWRISADGKAVGDIHIAPAAWDSEPLDIEQIDVPIAVQADGKIIARRGYENIMFRSNVDDTIDASFGNNGLLDTTNIPFSDIEIAPDGSLITRGGGGVDNTIAFTRLFREEGPAGQFDGRFIKAARSTAVRFSVIWRDDDGVKQSSIDSSDIKVSGPFDGVQKTRSASLELVESLGGGRYRATYKITSPGGWSGIDNGTYSVKLIAGQVEDVNGVAASARTLGTFRVRIT